MARFGRSLLAICRTLAGGAALPAARFPFVGKGLTVTEPWASAIAYVGKDVENRTRRTHYRGPVAIHAGLTVWNDDLQRRVLWKRGEPKCPLEELIAAGQRRYWLNVEDDMLAPGSIVAIAMLVDCVVRSKSPWYSGGDYFGWVLQGVIPIEPIPWTGALGLWTCKFRYRPLWG